MRGFGALEEDDDDVEECFIRNVEAEESEEVWVRNVDKQIGQKNGGQKGVGELGRGRHRCRLGCGQVVLAPGPG